MYFILSVIIVLIVILVLIIISLIVKKRYITQEGFQNKKFTKCESSNVRGIMKDIFLKNNISKSTDWDIYIPCGYNNVESELKKVNAIRDDQIIFGISGCDKIVSKNNIWTLLSDSFGRKKASSIMPETYVLNNEEDMRKFTLDYKNQL